MDQLLCSILDHQARAMKKQSSFECLQAVLLQTHASEEPCALDAMCTSEVLSNVEDSCSYTDQMECISAWQSAFYGSAAHQQGRNAEQYGKLDLVAIIRWAFPKARAECKQQMPIAAVSRGRAQTLIAPCQHRRCQLL